jgi:16S rRNA G1207 methylase RsmC
MAMNRIIISKVAAVILLFLMLLSVFAYNIYMFCDMFSKKAPYVGSFARHLKIMKEQLTLKKGATLLDLGCGDGKAMRFFRKYFELGQIDGYEVNYFATTW